MSQRIAVWTSGALKAAVVLVGLAYVGMYLFVALSRIGYPYELEWMEGAHVDYVRRILSGQPIYLRPSIEFTPFISPRSPASICRAAGSFRCGWSPWSPPWDPSRWSSCW